MILKTSFKKDIDCIQLFSIKEDVTLLMYISIFVLLQNQEAKKKKRCSIVAQRVNKNTCDI